MLQTLRVLLSLGSVLTLIWGTLALFYRLNLSGLILYTALGVWLLLGIGLLVLLWTKPLAGVLGLVALFAALGLWWSSLTPSNDRDWADDVAHTLTGQISQNTLTLKGVRHFDWYSQTDYHVKWEDRQYDLRQVQTVDVITSYWGMPAIAHVIVSFGFSNGEYLAFSVEIRRERHEVYSELGGFFKEYELSIIAADENDVVKVRSNVRDEDLYLYRLNITQEMAQNLLKSYVETANELAQTPRFYHTLTANCTTVVFNMARDLGHHLPFDHRLLLTGYLPAYLAELGALEDMDLETLKAKGRITERARAVTLDDNFSAVIRQGVPGIH